MKRIILILALLVVVPFIVTACGQTQANIVAHNISKAAEEFQVPRRIVFINGITDKYLAVIQGYCSVESANSALAGSLEVTCKTAPNEYKKSYFGLSDNVTYTVQQIDPIDVSNTRYKFIFRPSTIIPDIQLK